VVSIVDGKYRSVVKALGAMSDEAAIVDEIVGFEESAGHRSTHPRNIGAQEIHLLLSVHVMIVGFAT
jgi:hypothetical protein